MNRTNDERDKTCCKPRRDKRSTKVSYVFDSCNSSNNLSSPLNSPAYDVYGPRDERNHHRSQNNWHCPYDPFLVCPACAFHLFVSSTFQNLSSAHPKRPDQTQLHRSFGFCPCFVNGSPFRYRHRQKEMCCSVICID